MRSTLTLDDWIALGRGRWTTHLLADLAVHRGARFVELTHRLELPRDSLVRTLHAADAANWIRRNPGHGHPLRPEYVLTREGARLAAGVAELLAAQAQLGLSPGALTRWGLPLIQVIGAGQSRFNEFARNLASATPRAISQSLQTLAGHDLVLREVSDGRPPGSLYCLTSNGKILAAAL
jgi:DNA-binding HxlR family transcriptional regulator